MIAILIGFLVCGATIVAAGVLLGYSAERIGELTGLGGVWAGLVLLAAATSLPELATDVYAVRAHATNLAVGDLFGSGISNMLVLAVADLIAAKRLLFEKASFESSLTACLAIILNLLGAIFVLIHSDISIFELRPESTVLIGIYLLGTWMICRRDSRVRLMNSVLPGKNGTRQHCRADLSRSVVEFAAGAVMILIAAPGFVGSAKELSEITGLGTSFVGTWLVGLTTALPEAVTSYTAIRMGAFDLAVATLFGSSAFNMVVFFPMDLASPEGSVFGAANRVLALSGLLAVALMAIALTALLKYDWKPAVGVRRRSGLILVCYALAVLIVYSYSR